MAAAALATFAAAVSSLAGSPAASTRWALEPTDSVGHISLSGWGLHGAYGLDQSHQFKLWGTSNETAILGTDNIRVLSSPAPGAELWVVESTSAATLASIQRELLTGPQSDALTVLAVVPESAALVVAGELRKARLVNATNIISVPQKPIVAPRHPLRIPKAATELPTNPDPNIVEALRLVSAESLMNSVTSLSDFHTRQSTSYQAVDAEIWIASKFIRYGFEISTFSFRTNYSANVNGILRGTKYPDQYVIAGSHYDSRARDSSDPSLRAPGADDNGSGMSAVLELAKIIHEKGLQFEYTLVLCAFSGEEQGLVGSRAYAASLAESGQEVVAMFNSDMLGWKLPGTKPTAGMKDRFIADWLLNAANAYTELYVPEIIVGSSASCCSDHQSFTENGFPAIGFFENSGSASNYPHYHQETDLPEYLDRENFLLLTRAMMASVLSFAVIDLDVIFANAER